jgi:hypothetical protein
MNFLRSVLSLDHLAEEKNDRYWDEQAQNCKGKNAKNRIHLCLLLIVVILPLV